MVELTLFEVHLDGAEFTANAPFSSADADEAESAGWSGFGGDDETESEAEDEGSSPVGALLAVGALVLLVVVLRKVLGGEDDEA